MYITCLDVEGVLVPEIWIAFAEASGIPELKKTTRDEPDYDKLMNWRLGILKEHGLGLKEIQETIAKIDPLPGAREFLDELRTFSQVILISDTFTQFATPLMEKLGYAPQALKRGGIVGIAEKAEQADMAKLAEALGVARPTLNRWITNGWLEPCRVQISTNGDTLFAANAVREVLERFR